MENSLITEQRFAFIDYLFDEHNLDALFISQNNHIRYLTGFTGSNALLLITRRKMYFITDSRYEVQAADEVNGWQIVIARRGLIEEVKRKNFLRNAGRIGFESKHITYEQYKKLRRLFPGKRWSGLEVTLEPIMLQKEQYEIDNIKKAIAISERVLNSIINVIKPGVTEKEVAAEITYLHRKYGAEGDAFDPIVASGPRAALPHGRPSGKAIGNNELIIIDLGCKVNGYHSDITRTLAVGDPHPDAKACYTIVHDALARAIDSVAEGIQCKKLDGIGRGYIKQNGFGDYFSHSLGHGIGLDVHELPRISPYSNEQLVSGSTITVEPGIYIPERFGIRIEDDILVTEDGGECLTTLTKDLIKV